MKSYGEIKLIEAERDEQGNSWVVTMRVTFGVIGSHRATVRIRMSERHDDADKMSLAQAEAEAYRIVVRDLLLLARTNAEWLPEKTRETLIQAFPPADQPKTDGE
ncbi:hypothetical protein [Phyllobacterium phragmitis]|uniref:hypothetical protein n=1 Tax=Phyllobacterium phragmitis TaxID=2670329 RepID=UPI0011B25764|nr:hypothetical protein [Phyllobacterium phragmitis]